MKGVYNTTEKTYFLQTQTNFGSSMIRPRKYNNEAPPCNNETHHWVKLRSRFHLVLRYKNIHFAASFCHHGEEASTESCSRNKCSNYF